MFGFTSEQVIANLKLQMATAWWVMRWPFLVICLVVAALWLWGLWIRRQGNERELQGNYKFRE